MKWFYVILCLSMTTFSLLCSLSLFINQYRRKMSASYGLCHCLEVLNTLNQSIPLCNHGPLLLKTYKYIHETYYFFFTLATFFASLWYFIVILKILTAIFFKYWQETLSHPPKLYLVYKVPFSKVALTFS